MRIKLWSSLVNPLARFFGSPIFRSLSGLKGFLRYTPVFLFLAFGPCVSSIEAQTSWPDPQTTPGTLGNILEQRFTNLLSNCITDSLRKKVKLGADGKHTAIPGALQTLPLSEAASSYDQTMAGIFTLIFSQSDVATKALQDPNLNNYVLFNYSTDPVTLTAQQFSAGVYQESCGSVMQSASSAKLGISFPAAAINSELSYDYSNSSNEKLIVANGFFQSPLSALLAAHDYRHIYGDLLFWLWYSNNYGHLADHLSYVSQFRGLSITEALGSQQDFKGNITASGNAGISVASIEASASAQATTSTSNTQNNYATVLLNDPSWQYGQVPSASAIEADALAATPYLISSDATTLYQGKSTKMTVGIDGVPAAMCNNSSSNWSVSALAGSVAGQLDLSSVSVHPPTGGSASLSTCQFSLSFRPDSSLFPPNAPPASPEIVYQLSHSIGNPPNTSALKFHAVTMSFNLSGAPDLNVSPDNSAMFTATIQHVPGQSDQTSLTWSMKLLYTDGGDALVTVAATPPIGQVNCGGVNTSVNLVPTLNIAGKSVGLALEKSVASASVDATSSQACTLTGSLTIDTATRPGVPRSITMPISFPAAPKPLPDQPKGLVGTAGAAQITLVWNPVAGATGYNVYRSSSTGAETLVKANTTAVQFMDSGLTAGAPYFYEVTAISAAGEGPKSLEVSATPH